MPYYYEILCLANSNKYSGRCVAGKITEGPRAGHWLRPIGTGEKHEITDRDRLYQDNSYAQKLDIIRIKFKALAAPSFQQENNVIDDETYWVKTAQATLADLENLLDHPRTLWENGNHSYSGVNDRVSTDILTQPRQTLLLIKPTNVRISVEAEGAQFGNFKRVVRAHFTYNSIDYALTVKDAEAEAYYLSQPDGEYPISANYFTISLGEAYKGEAYKLVAAIF
ncbi:hypothetical protein HBN99_16195 [Pseudomonas oryzihabitans]|uniref:dual OB domain-containing protein n=1 Tax=Pseudomonas oryzihabitans TaxID=47885 RepID=UPI001472FE7E|nr:hypothetical protein [Pseudomonas oryzihabitans]NMZ65864.1 hypothetical protein [Pseudomonas oryzihabitans]